MSFSPVKSTGKAFRAAAFATGLAAVAAVAVPTSSAATEEYPSKPVRVIVNSAPGGLTDVIGRLLTNKMSESMGKPMVVENRTGAGGVLGADALRRSPADGYTIGVVANGITSGPFLLPEVPFMADKDFDPIALLMTTPMVMVTSINSPYKDLDSFVKEAKKDPGALSIASGGIGTMTHLVAEQFQAEADLKLVHVPYKGGGPALVDVMAGHVPVYFDTLTTSANLIREGKLRGLAVVNDERSDAIPDVPTLAEQGYPGVKGISWFAMIAPAGTPKEILQRLNEEANKALESAEVKERISSLGGTIQGGSSEVLAELISSEIPRWSKLIKDRGITAQ